MKANKRKKVKERQQKLQARLAHKDFTSPSQPLLGGLPMHYELAERTRVISMGGLGALHTLVTRLDLPALLNAQVSVFKRHLPYWESDHILSVCYNVLTGGKPLQDMNRLRRDEGYLEALGVERLPAPSTAGDFLRRFKEDDILALQEGIHQARQKVWQHLPEPARCLATIDVDGTLVETDAQGKEGIDYCAYKKQWGYGPLLVSLAETGEVLYVVNRSAAWIQRALDQVQPAFETVWLRGDTAFSLTQEFDDWDEQGVRFIFGYDAYDNLIQQAQALEASAWETLLRPPKYEIKTVPRTKPKNVKQAIVEQRGFERIETIQEEVACFDYQPTQCKKGYRMLVLRKHLRITKKGKEVEQTIRYFFYSTNDWMGLTPDLVLFYDERGGQEHLIGQLKSSVPAFHAPADTLLANGTYMVIAALAWNLKAWYGLLLKEPTLQQQVVRMEFKQFLERFIHLPCQIIHSGRRLLYRVVQFTTDTLTVLDSLEQLNALRFP